MSQVSAAVGMMMRPSQNDPLLNTVWYCIGGLDGQCVTVWNNRTTISDISTAMPTIWYTCE